MRRTSLVALLAVASLTPLAVAQEAKGPLEKLEPGVAFEYATFPSTEGDAKETGERRRLTVTAREGGKVSLLDECWKEGSGKAPEGAVRSHDANASLASILTLPDEGVRTRGREAVTVPAGTFADCEAIEGGSGSFRATWWLAPKLALPVRIVFDLPSGKIDWRLARTGSLPRIAGLTAGDASWAPVTTGTVYALDRVEHSMGSETRTRVTLTVQRKTSAGAVIHATDGRADREVANEERPWGTNAVSVLGVETITVPAGTFECLKISAAETRSGRFHTYWMSRTCPVPIRHVDGGEDWSETDELASIKKP